MKADEIRSRFLGFFVARGHRPVGSSSLVPANDPTLLFTNAGMNQFKDVFLGREKRDYVRACSSQKCVRAGGKHNDLEQVGRTTRHHTFFEMLGNFSFGDYFKKEAIPWAWELVTKDFAIPREKLYVTTFLGSGSGPEDHDVVPRDDEAHDLWVAQGVGEDRIFKLGLKENFWQMGDTGPCGPCSEIHYDLGPAAGEQGHKDCKFPCDCGRYVELWNLVFMQYDRRRAGVNAYGVPSYELSLLPKPCVDTGAGLERLATVLQGKVSNFDTDLFRPLIEEAASLANVDYGATHETDVSLRIIADHARAATFLISDGVLPSNEGRGYVLRKIIRRAADFGRQAGIQKPFLGQMSAKVVELMGEPYPELSDAEDYVARILQREEGNYARLVGPAVELLRSRVERQPKKAFHEVEPLVRGYLTGPEFVQFRETFGSDKKYLLKGEDLFFAYTTLGLRPDQVHDLAQSRGWLLIETAQDEFAALLAEERERARFSWKGFAKEIALPVYLEVAETNKTIFDGYTQMVSTDCHVLALVQDDHPIEEATRYSGPVHVVLDHTPFYAEAGGQVGDKGWFMDATGVQRLATINDTSSPVSGLIVHEAVNFTKLRVGDVVTAQVDAKRRDAIRRNHTATHLLHAALRKTLGTHVKQAGSLVAPDRLRFDFTHYAALDPQDLLDIEDLVNQHVMANEEMRTDVMDLDTAISTGAMALFGEKYGDKVRVVSVADGSFSKELCGGTHVRRTGDLGLFKVVSEASVAAGTRRIEAVTGEGVVDYLRRATETLAEVTQVLRAKPGEVVQAAEKLTESEKKLRKQLESQQLKRAAGEAGDLVAGAKEIKGVRVVSARVDVTDRAAMRQMVDGLRGKLGSGVIVLGSASDGKVALIAAVTKDLTDRLDAGKIVKEAAILIEGTGGGRKDLAEAGGKNPEKLQESLDSVPSIVERFL